MERTRVDAHRQTTYKAPETGQQVASVPWLSVLLVPEREVGTLELDFSSEKTRSWAQGCSGERKRERKA